VGTEREKQQKAAGLRTLILVCLGSSVFTMVSFVFTSTTGDSGRVAAQVVTGIGFLGAGSIIHSRGAVIGMTTAATIWMMAAIGVTVGAGYPLGALGASVLVRTVLASVHRWEIRHLGGMRRLRLELILDPDHGKAKAKLYAICDEFNVDTQSMAFDECGDGTVKTRLRLELARKHLHEFLDQLADLPAVKAMQQIPEDA